MLYGGGGESRKEGGKEEKRKVTKITMLPELIYQFNATSIKILECF